MLALLLVTKETPPPPGDQLHLVHIRKSLGREMLTPKWREVLKILRSMDLEIRKEVEGMVWGREQPEMNKRNNYFRKDWRGGLIHHMVKNVVVESDGPVLEFWLSLTSWVASNVLLSLPVNSAFMVFKMGKTTHPLLLLLEWNKCKPAGVVLVF